MRKRTVRDAKTIETALREAKALAAISVTQIAPAERARRKDLLAEVFVAEDAADEPGIRVSKSDIRKSCDVKKMFRHGEAQERAIFGSHIVRRANQIMNENLKMSRSRALSMAMAEGTRGGECHQTHSEKRAVAQGRRKAEKLRKTLISAARDVVLPEGLIGRLDSDWQGRLLEANLAAVKGQPLQL